MYAITHDRGLGQAPTVLLTPEPTWTSMVTRWLSGEIFGFPKKYVAVGGAALALLMLLKR